MFYKCQCWLSPSVGVHIKTAEKHHEYENSTRCELWWNSQCCRVWCMLWEKVQQNKEFDSCLSKAISFVSRKVLTTGVVNLLATSCSAGCIDSSVTSSISLEMLKRSVSTTSSSWFTSISSAYESVQIQLGTDLNHFSETVQIPVTAFLCRRVKSHTVPSEDVASAPSDPCHVFKA